MDDAPNLPPSVVWSWALYDWANSAFTTIVVTFVYSTYFTQAIAPDALSGTVWWSRAAATAGILIGLLSPVLGVAADRSGTHKRFLGLTTGICVVVTAALTFVPPGRSWSVVLALALFVVADVAYETALVFYNAFLPKIASPDRLGRVSGYAWGLGYVGGIASLAIALVGFVQPAVPWFGLSKAQGFNIRATNLLVAVWVALFALPIFLYVPERTVKGTRVEIGATFKGLVQTLRAVARYREAARFLVAQLVFNDGLVTIFAFGGIYAAGTFGMSLAEVIVFGIAINVAAGIGAAVFGVVDDRIGGKRTIMVTLFALTIAVLVAVFAPSRAWFWVSGILIGIFVGPNQSASRSLMARFSPPAQLAEFFGFFNFSGKVTSFMGPLLLGLATSAFGSQRAGVATVIIFFVVGGVLLAGVNERRGIEAAGRG